MTTEQDVLRVSVLATLVLAGLGIGFGLYARSFSIVFDGVYLLVDASMSALALIATRLIAAASTVQRSPKLHERFNLGLWHLEPMVLGLNSVLLVGAAIYALLNALGSLMAGGRELQFGYAIVYAIVSLGGCVAMAILESRVNRRIRSDFVALDVQGWIMSSGISAALLLAFCIGYLVDGTSNDWIAPYVDPTILVVVCLVLIPIPIGSLRRALAEIFLVTPRDLKHQVDEIASRIVREQGFIRHHAYVAKVGRGRLIELHFLVAPGEDARRLEQWDALRDEIGRAIGGAGPDRWLTIAFTTDAAWAT